MIQPVFELCAWIAPGATVEAIEKAKKARRVRLHLHRHQQGREDMPLRKSAELLLAAAESLDNYNSPFCDEFLTKHEVTFDQCMALSQQLAIGARIMARGVESPTSDAGIAMLTEMARHL
jgi:hypothetical protein